MKIEKKTVQSGILKLEKNVQITIDQDMNVPDTKPDVEKIVESRGEVHIDEVEIMTDRIRIRGMFFVQLLYLSAEKEQKISCMEHEFALEEFMNVEGAQPTDTARVMVDLEDLTVSVINSRKCGVRSVLFFHIHISETKFVECSVGVEKRGNVQCLYESVPMTEIVLYKKDIQRIRAEVSLPAGKPNIREILWNSMQLRDVDVRMQEGKLSIRGELFLFILYRGEEEQEPVQYYDWEIPFTSELECSDSRENLIGSIAASLGSHQSVVKPDEDGEPRSVEVDAVLELDLKGYREFQMPVLKEVLDATEGAWIANYNSPAQIVITGYKEAVELAVTRLTEKGVKRCVMLNVSGPFHSPLLKGAGEKLGEVLEDVSLGKLSHPYYANIDAARVEDESLIKERLINQVSGSVHWQQIVEAMLDEGVDLFIEVGPGKTLSGFVQKILRAEAKDKGRDISGIKLINIETPEDISKIDGVLEER